MKTKKQKNRDSSSLPARLAAYSATAAAVLSAPETQATVLNIYSPTVTFDLPGTTGTLALNVGPFHGSFQGGFGDPDNGHTNTFFGSAKVNGHIAADADASAYKLNFGSAIQPKNFNNVGQLANEGIRFDGGIFLGSFHHGAFNLTTTGQHITGYVGFKTVQNAQTYYGWLRVQVVAGSRGLPDQVSLLQDGNGIIGAFDFKNSGITAGQIGPVPEPGSVAVGGLGLLALGARGVREYRRRRNQAAKN